MHRAAHALHGLGVPILPLLIFRLMRILFATSIAPSATIGRGSTLGYAGLGTVIHGDVVIGSGCTISQGVTLGGRGGSGAQSVGVPHVGSGVVIGAGAKVLGPINIGDHARIGANAVVLNDVTASTTVAGVPARVVTRSGRG